MQVGTPDENSDSSNLSQNIKDFMIKATYNLTYSVWLNQCTQQTGFVGALILDSTARPTLERTFDACDDGRAAVYHYVDVWYSFTARATKATLKFDLVVGEYHSTIKLGHIGITRIRKEPIAKKKSLLATAQRSILKEPKHVYGQT